MRMAWVAAQARPQQTAGPLHFNSSNMHGSMVGAAPRQQQNTR